MQIHRSDGGESPQRRANPSPPVGNRVFGLGESHALRVDFEPVQLPWLANEIDTVRSVIEEELVRARAQHDQEAAGPGREGSPSAGEAEDEVERREYQLLVLRMIREQVPVRPAVAAACVEDPWEQASELALELAGITAPVTVVGPAQGMLFLLRGAVRNVADALGEAVRLSERKQRDPRIGTAATHWPERSRLSAPVANRVRDIASAAQAFTDDYLNAVRLQAYIFDPEHYPAGIDELW